MHRLIWVDNKSEIVSSTEMRDADADADFRVLSKMSICRLTVHALHRIARSGARPAGEGQTGFDDGRSS